MKKCLFVLMVCLMATSAFAVSNSWNVASGSWSLNTNWNNSVLPVNSTIPGDNYRIFNGTKNVMTIDSALGTFGGQIRIASALATPATLNIVAGGSISIAEFRVGENGLTSSGSSAVVNQTGGSVTMIASSSGTATNRNLIIGRHGNSTVGAADGTYKISGGSLGYDNSMGFNDAKLFVGANNNAAGTGPTPPAGKFQVIGSASSVTMRKLYVGSDGTGAGAGTMQFDVVDGAVSKVALTDNDSILLCAGGLGVANLVVTLTGAVPTADILLIENQGTGAVSGTFTGLAEGAAVGAYTLTYLFDGATGTRGTGNDIALLIPEPATIALLSIGLLALRRNRK